MLVKKKVRISIDLDAFKAYSKQPNPLEALYRLIVSNPHSRNMQFGQRDSKCIEFDWNDNVSIENAKAYLAALIAKLFDRLPEDVIIVEVKQDPEDDLADKAELLRQIEFINGVRDAQERAKKRAAEDAESREKQEELEGELDDTFNEDDFPAAENKPEEEPQEPQEPKKSVLEMIRALNTGDFALLAEEMLKTWPLAIQNNLTDILYKRSYLFSINDEESFREYLRMFQLVLKEMELIRRPTMVHHAVFHLPDNGSHRNPMDEVRRVAIREASADRLRIVSIDISEWMSKTGDVAFREMLRLLEKNRRNVIYFFRIPFVECEVLHNILANIADVLTVQPVCIPPLSMEELVQRAEAMLAGYDYQLDDEARNVLSARFVQEKSDGRFYGISTVRKVAEEALYIKLQHEARHETNNMLMKGAEILPLANAACMDERSGMEILEDFVGIDAIRDRMLEIIAQIEMSVKNPELGAPCIHMRFVGSPGTGKTTIARVIGKILREKGVLRNGNFFEHTGREFCGRFVGETAPKTASMCRDAYGSVLFIDEAYALYSDHHIGSNDFGKEALDTLITEMENHRNDLLVIMAGYPDEMKTLMQGNSGLESRMPYVIEFPNYTREQLADIFMKMTEKHFEHEDELEEAVRTYFNNLPEELVTAKTFSNARYVRNLFERTWGKAVLRSQLDHKEEVWLTREDFEAASADHEFKNPDAKKPHTLGFV